MTALLVVAAMALAGAPPSQAPGTKRALLIGVAYQQASFQLGTKPDVEAMSALLTDDTFGFKKENVTILDEQSETSSAAIVRALDKLAADTKDNDIVVVHYAGHGDQVADTNGDESDGQDECLVGSETDGKTGMVTDDLLNAKLDALLARAKRVIVVFDSCHSGTGIRGFRVRSLPRSVGTEQEGHHPLASGDQIEVAPQTDKGSGMDAEKTKGRSQLIFFAAAASDEKALDDGKGVFTDSLVRSLRELSRAGKVVTAADVHERATAIIRARGIHIQTPQVEGNPNSDLISGDVLEVRPYFRVDRTGPKSFKIPAGYLHGIGAESVFGIYKPGSRDPVKERDTGFICEVDVVSTGPFESSIGFRSIEDMNKMLAASGDAGEGILAVRAFELERHLPDNQLAVVIDEQLAKHAGWAAIKAELDKSKIVTSQAVRNRDLKPGDAPTNFVLLRLKDNKEIVVERTDGSLVPLDVDSGEDTPPKAYAMLSADPNAPKTIAATIGNESRWHFIRGLRNQSPNPRAAFEIKLIKIKTKPDPSDPTNRLWVSDTDEVIKQGTAEARFRPGDYFRIAVKNVGLDDAYVSIIDLTSDGGLACLWPLYKLGRDKVAMNTPADRVDPAKGWFGLSAGMQDDGVTPDYMVYIIEDQLGEETLKVIASTTFVDMEPAMTRALTRNANEGPLQRMFKDVSLGQQRSSPRSRADRSSWSTTTVTFKVVKGDGP